MMPTLCVVPIYGARAGRHDTGVWRTMGMREVFSFPHPVNEVAARTVATGVVGWRR
jgi:hypothetical protein